MDAAPRRADDPPASGSPSDAVLVDTHAHLDVEEFDADRDAVLGRARRAGVAAIVCPGITAASSAKVVALATPRQDHTNVGVFAAVGIQPNYTAQAAPDDWATIERLAEDPCVVAVGETGLDRYWDYSPLDVQRDWFDRHLRLAQRRDLPVILHCREAEADMLPMLRDAANRGPLRGVMHSFSGDDAFARACLELGLYLSLSGPLTYTNWKFDVLREVARRAPADRITVETDSPYLTPHPLRGKQKRNEPAHVTLVAAQLAQLRGCTLTEIAGQTSANARRLFRLPG